MRKVIVVDVIWLKNGYGGVLIFVKVQDSNRYCYLFAFVVFDGENYVSWIWFFEMFRSVISDFSELVFMSDRNLSLIFVIVNVYFQVYYGYCLWYLKENVKGYVFNVIKDVVGYRFMELGKMYIMVDFNAVYERFKLRFFSVYTYVEEKTEKDKWVRVFFLRDRYNLDISNSVELMNKVFREVRRWVLILMLDCIIRIFSDWFNQRRKDAVL